ncbi:MAG TPA: hypothetical protein VFL62_06030 [Bradyrhizobium sp.]|uniref:hypothetical protein n=1 Tax=Bradyrhizobium sp. TaxID=376 RepID=UPI002D7F35CB|nr:hypothetical protein [Bradyrhizobium sp.]HET7885768.1 hypothetical protein [Bradyrhizobium sp.]
MIDNVLRDLQVLRKADLLIGKIWLGVFARRLSLFAFAGLIAVFGLGMANLAAYNALLQPIGLIWAATVVAVADVVIAAVVLLIGSSSRPGPEIDMAFEMRRMALDSMQENARELKISVDAISQEVRNVKQNVAAVVHNPFDVAAQKLLVPAVLSILKGMRSKKEHS